MFILAIALAAGAGYVIFRGPPSYATTDELIAALKDEGWTCASDGGDTPTGGEGVRSVVCDLRKGSLESTASVIAVYNSEEKLDEVIAVAEEANETSYCEFVGFALVQGPNWQIALSDEDDAREAADEIADGLNAEVFCRGEF